MMYSLKALAVLFLSLLPLTLAAQTPLVFVAEDLPPLHYQDHNGQVTGAIVEVVRAVIKQSGLQADIVLMPMARAFHELESHNGTLMMSLLRSKEREHSLIWIGQTYKTSAHLIGLKQNQHMHLQNLHDALQYRVATIRGYHSETFLREAGFTENNNLFLANNYKAMWHMLARGRIDLILTNTLTLERELASADLAPELVEKKLSIDDFPGELYIAANTKLDPGIVTKLTTALQTIKDSGEYAAIMKKWRLMQ